LPCPWPWPLPHRLLNPVVRAPSHDALNPCAMDTPRFEGCLVSEFSGLTFDKDVEGMLSDKASAPAAAAASQPAGVWQRLAGAVEVSDTRPGGVCRV
jgi:hypothetical protein